MEIAGSRVPPSSISPADDESMMRILYSDMGVGILLARLKQSVLSCKDLAAYVKKKSYIEESYVSDIKKLVKNTRDGITKQDNRHDSFSRQFSEIVRLDENLNTSRNLFLAGLSNMHDELIEVSRSMEKARKAQKEANIKNEKVVQEAEQAMEKAKSKLNSLVEELEKLRNSDPNKKTFTLRGSRPLHQHEEEIQRKTTAAENEYNLKVKSALYAKNRLLTTLRPDVVHKLKDLIAECDAAMTLQLQRYANLCEAKALYFGVTICPLRTSANMNLSMRDLACLVDNKLDLYNYVMKSSNGKLLSSKKLDASNIVSMTKPYFQPSYYSNSVSNMKNNNLNYIEKKSNLLKIGKKASNPRSPLSLPPTMSTDISSETEQNARHINTPYTESYTPVPTISTTSDVGNNSQTPNTTTSHNTNINTNTNVNNTTNNNNVANTNNLPRPAGVTLYDASIDDFLNTDQEEEEKAEEQRREKQRQEHRQYQQFHQFQQQYPQQNQQNEQQQQQQQQQYQQHDQHLHHQHQQPHQPHQPHQQHAQQPHQQLHQQQQQQLEYHQHQQHQQQEYPGQLQQQYAQQYNQQQDQEKEQEQQQPQEYKHLPQLPQLLYKPPISLKPKTTGNHNNTIELTDHQGPPPATIFGGEIEVVLNFEGGMVPYVVFQCIKTIDDYGLDIEGIYRSNGSTSIIQDLRAMFNNPHLQPANLIKPPDFNNDINSIAGLLKQYFRELPEPLLTLALREEFLAAAQIEDPTLRRDAIHLVVNKLPDANYTTLRYLIFHLNRVQEHERNNRMSAYNLGIVWGPNLVGTENGDVTHMTFRSQVVESIVANCYSIFNAD